MRPAPSAKPRPMRIEQIILFRISGHLFAVSSASVQEVRSSDSISGLTFEITVPAIRKVRHAVNGGDQPLFIVNGCLHFGLAPAPGALILVLRNTRTALLIEGIERMTGMTRLQSLPQSFCHEERQWYRGLTALDQTVVPVVNAGGFLSTEELAQLDAALVDARNPDAATEKGAELPQ